MASAYVPRSAPRPQTWRTGSTAQCYGRGFHVANWNADGSHGACLDCGSDGSDKIPIQDAALAPPREPSHRPVQAMDLDDDFAARMAERQKTPEERRAAHPSAPQTFSAPIEMTPEIAKLAFHQYLTREAYIAFAPKFGFAIQGDILTAAGHSAHIGAEVQSLRHQVEALMERARLAEASSAAAQRELAQLRAESATPQPSEDQPQEAQNA